jgi:hypothetical protein
MWILTEILFAAWVLAGVWMLARRGPSACIDLLLRWLVAYAVAAMAGWLGAAAIGLWSANLWMRLVAACVCGTIAFAIVIWYWSRCVRRSDPHRWLQALDVGLAGRIVMAAVFVCWTAGHFLAWVVAVNLISAAYPAAGDAARSRSLVTRYLLGTPPGLAWERELSRQNLGLRGLAGGVDRVLDASGARRVMELADAVAWIGGMDPGERARLMVGSPELERLMGDPAMLAVINDPRVMQEVDEALLGSLTATYALGSEPAIIALVDSPAMRAAMRAVDPVALRRRAQTSQGTDGLAWETGSIGSSLGLDAQLGSASGWTPTVGTRLFFAGAERFGVARGRLPARPEPWRLQVETTAPFSCWCAGVLLRPLGHGPVYEIPIPATGGEVVLLIDFDGLPQPHAMVVR